MNLSKDSPKYYPDIDDNIYSRILELCRQGDAYVELKEFAKAIESYHQAFESKVKIRYFCRFKKANF